VSNRTGLGTKRGRMGGVDGNKINYLGCGMDLYGRQVLVILLTLALPTAWLVAEFKARPAVRRTLGILMFLWSFGIAFLIGAMRDFSANVYFTNATKDLLSASVTALNEGKTQAVVREWKQVDEAFEPTYENRAGYRKKVDRAIEGMKKP